MLKYGIKPFACTLVVHPNLIVRRQGGPEGAQAVQELSAVCQRPLQSSSGVKPTQLFSRNADVDRVNTEELKALQGEAVSHHLTLFDAVQTSRRPSFAVAANCHGPVSQTV